MYMTTLTSKPCADVVARLFEEADASDARLAELRRAVPENERTRLMAGAGDSRELYSRLKDFHLAVSRPTASLLYILARACRAKAIVEFGTSFGVSTVHLAAALRDNGGGRLIGTEFEPAKAARARENIAAAGLGDLVEIREGDALETLVKGLYPRVLSLLEANLHPGSLIVADNADWSAEYLARVRDPASGFVGVPFADDVELSMKV
jgi:predicted O-methyltransferase YrrM